MQVLNVGHVGPGDAATRRRNEPPGVGEIVAVLARPALSTSADSTAAPATCNRHGATTPGDPAPIDASVSMVTQTQPSGSST